MRQLAEFGKDLSRREFSVVVSNILTIKNISSKPNINKQLIHSDVSTESKKYLLKSSADAGVSLPPISAGAFFC